MMSRRITTLVPGTCLFLALAACGGDERPDPAPGARVASPPGSAFLDPNAASARDLEGAGLAPAAAAAVVAARPYPDNLALDRVFVAQDLTEEQRDSVFARVWTPIDPNTASDREILLIPGVGDRMLGEFEEYRPWTSVEQFRREIGKYVDAEELARLERYVRLPS